MKRLCVLAGKEAFWEKHVATDTVLKQGLRDFSQGHYASSDLKRLKNKTYQDRPMYRLKLNNAARVLITFLPPNNQATLLDYIPTHRYKRSAVFNGDAQAGFGVSEFDLEDNAEVSSADLAKLMAGTSVFDGHFTSLVPCASRWVSLDGLQESTIHIKKPAIIEGVPGSGKTLTGLALLSAELSNLFEREAQEIAPPGQKICYVAHSASLVEMVKEEWKKYGYPAAWNERVEFITTSDLLKKSFPDRELVGKNHFSEWYERRQKHKKNVLPYAASLIEKELSSCEVYREQYGALGKDKSHIVKADRAKVYQIYTEYKAHLESTQCMNEYLCAPVAQPKYAFTFVDEYQDLNYSALRFVTGCTKHDQIIYSGDLEQNIKSNYQSDSYLRDLHHPVKLTKIELPKSYRLTVKGARAANIPKKLEEKLKQGKRKGETTEVKEVDENNPLGHAYFVPLDKLNDCPFLKQSKGADFAVVTTKEHLEEARRIFGDDTVIHTVETIKGMQYRTVVVYKLLDEHFFKEAKHILESQEERVIQHQPKNKQAENPFDLPCDTLYTVLSRSTENLIVCDEETENNDLFLDEYKQICDPGLPPVDLLLQTASSAADWIIQAWRLWNTEGGKDMATMVYQKRLGWKDSDWQEFLESKQDSSSPPSNSQGLTAGNRLNALNGPRGQAAGIREVGVATVNVDEEKPDGGRPIVSVAKTPANSTPAKQSASQTHRKGKKKKPPEVAVKPQPKKEKQNQAILKQTIFAEEPPKKPAEEKLTAKQIDLFSKTLHAQFSESAVTAVLKKCTDSEEIREIFFRPRSGENNKPYVLLDHYEDSRARNTVFLHAILKNTKLLNTLPLHCLPEIRGENELCNTSFLRIAQQTLHQAKKAGHFSFPTEKQAIDVPVLLLMSNYDTKLYRLMREMGLYTDEEERSLLISFSIHWNQPEILQQLLAEEKGDVDSLLSTPIDAVDKYPSQKKRRPLVHFAASRGALASLQILVREFKADLKQTFENETLIHQAIRNGHRHVLQWALGVNSDLLEIGDPLDLAVKFHDLESVGVILRYAKASFIKAKGAQAYYLAMQHGNHHMCTLLEPALEKHGVEVKSKGVQPKSAKKAKKQEVSEEVLASEDNMHQFILEHPKGMKQLVDRFFKHREKIFALVFESDRNREVYSKVVDAQFIPQLNTIFPGHEDQINLFMMQALRFHESRLPQTKRPEVSPEILMAARALQLSFSEEEVTHVLKKYAHDHQVLISIFFADHKNIDGSKFRLLKNTASFQERNTTFIHAILKNAELLETLPLEKFSEIVGKNSFCTMTNLHTMQNDFKQAVAHIQKRHPTPALFAVRERVDHLLKQLLEFDLYQGEECDLIAEALRLDNPKELEVLLDHSSTPMDILTVNAGNKALPLIFFAQSQGAVKCLDVLKLRGANLRCVVNDKTLVHEALMRKNLESLQWIVKEDPGLLSIWSPNIAFGSPVYFAAVRGLDQALELMLSLLDPKTRSQECLAAKARLETEEESEAGLLLLTRLMKKDEKLPESEILEDRKSPLPFEHPFQERDFQPIVRLH